MARRSARSARALWWSPAVGQRRRGWRDGVDVPGYAGGHVDGVGGVQDAEARVLMASRAVRAAMALLAAMVAANRFLGSEYERLGVAGPGWAR